MYCECIQLSVHIICFCGSYLVAFKFFYILYSYHYLAIQWIHCYLSLSGSPCLDRTLFVHLVPSVILLPLRFKVPALAIDAMNCLLQNNSREHIFTIGSGIVH